MTDSSLSRVGKPGENVGLCINILGIPILEDKACASKRRDQRNERKQIEEDSDVAKAISNDEKKMSNVYNRNQQQLGSSIARNFGSGGVIGQGFDFLTSAVTSGNQTASDIFGGSGGTIAGAYLTGGSSLLAGGLFGGVDPVTGAAIPPSPLVPLGLVALAAGLAYAATR